MNLKLKALLQTAAVFASAVVMAFVVDYIGKTADPETIRTVLGGAVIGAMAYMVYQLCLTRLQMNDSFKSAITNIDKK
jgi:zinc transporter ZupT